MVYLLRKLLSQQPCSQPFPWCPVGQLDQPLIQTTTPNYTTRELNNTDRLPSYTFQSEKPTFPFCILINLPSILVSLLLFLSCVVLMRPSGCMAARPLPYSHCHAQVIRPHNEDICATLINAPVVLPSNLFSTFLSCPC